MHVDGGGAVWVGVGRGGGRVSVFGVWSSSEFDCVVGMAGWCDRGSVWVESLGLILAVFWGSALCVEAWNWL